MTFQDALDKANKSQKQSISLEEATQLMNDAWDKMLYQEPEEPLEEWQEYLVLKVLSEFYKVKEGLING